MGREKARDPEGSRGLCGARRTVSHGGAQAPRECYAVNELPQPQPPVALGFLNVKPEPCMEET